MHNNFHDFLLEKYDYFIFDFDGIIKESVNVKGKAYCKLFNDYKFASKMIENHHLQNGGISRYEKIPLYLKFCNLKSNSKLVDFYLEKFSNIVTKLVINSEWVPGALFFLDKIKERENIFIVSATPEKELIKIVKKISLKIPIVNVHGSPKSKLENIRNFLQKDNLKKYIFFGDALSDSSVAEKLGIDFAYRKYDLNFNQVPNYYTYIFNDFNNDFN